MPSTPNIAIAIVAGVAIIGGAAYLEKDKLGLSPSGIRSVDLRNSQVEVVGTACADPQLTTAGIAKLPLHDGAYQLGQYQFELVGDVRYGDVSGHTGDNNSEKAVFVGSCSTAGKTSQVLFVYGMMDGNPERLASTDLSAGGNTLVQSYSVGDGAIQVKANQGDPPSLVTMSYALLNGKLVNLNPAAAQPAAQPTAQTTAETDTQTTPAATSDTIVNPQDQNAPAMQEDQVGFQTFHDSLAPYGSWVQHPRWGLVWHPTQVSADFRPYRDGHWEDNDEYGAVWVSDYSWGDIPFHYGRWGYDPAYGWLWQPGYTWSPAWVAWREGGGNIGWLPIPPNYYDGSGVFVDDWYGWYGYRSLYGAALDAAAFYALWSFVPGDDIFAPSIGIDVIAPVGYGGFIGRTVGWTRFGFSRGHLVNRAIDRDRFHRAFGHPLPASTRHDFLAHHGPIVGPARGRMIAAHERLAGHGAPSAARHVSSSHFGRTHMALTRGSGYPAYAHSLGNTHAYAHSSFGASRASFTQRSGYGATHSAYGGGYNQRSEIGGGYSQRSEAGSRAMHPSYGGGYNQRPEMGGGYSQRPEAGGGNSGFSQRPSFGGGMAARPAPSGGGFSRPAPQPQRSNNPHH